MRSVNINTALKHLKNLFVFHFNENQAFKTFALLNFFLKKVYFLFTLIPISVH